MIRSSKPATAAAAADPSSAHIGENISVWWAKKFAFVSGLVCDWDASDNTHRVDYGDQLRGHGVAGQHWHDLSVSQWKTASGVIRGGEASSARRVISTRTSKQYPPAVPYPCDRCISIFYSSRGRRFHKDNADDSAHEDNADDSDHEAGSESEQEQLEEEEEEMASEDEDDHTVPPPPAAKAESKAAKAESKAAKAESKAAKAESKAAPTAVPPPSRRGKDAITHKRKARASPSPAVSGRVTKAAKVVTPQTKVKSAPAARASSDTGDDGGCGIGDGLYEVERIEARMVDDDGEWWRVKWQGYEDRSWEPTTGIDAGILQAFRQKTDGTLKWAKWANSWWPCVRAIPTQADLENRPTANHKFIRFIDRNGYDVAWKGPRDLVQWGDPDVVAKMRKKKPTNLLKWALQQADRLKAPAHGPGARATASLTTAPQSAAAAGGGRKPKKTTKSTSRSNNPKSAFVGYGRSDGIDSDTDTDSEAGSAGSAGSAAKGQVGKGKMGHPLPASSAAGPPLCDAGHSMALSKFAGGAYAGGYYCERCNGKRSEGHNGGTMERWFCAECGWDVCTICVPKGPAGIQKRSGGGS